MKANDPRYPYTHADDHLRMLIGRNEQGSCKISRADASKIMSEIANVLGHSNHEHIASLLADKALLALDAIP